MLITKKFFKRAFPNLVSGEAKCVITMQGWLRMFIREDDDSDSPLRTCVQMTKAEAIALANHIHEYAQRMESNNVQ